MNKIILQKRDEEIISFIKEFHISDVNSIAKLFFNNSTQSASKRLLKLCNNGYLNKWRSSVIEPYLYYVGKRPKNYKHSLMVAQAYSLIKANTQIIKIHKEYQIKYRANTLVADMLIIIKDSKGKVVPIIVECECGTKYYNDKWSNYISGKYYLQKFPIEPIVVVFYKGDRLPKSSISVQLHKLNEIK